MFNESTNDQDEVCLELATHAAPKPPTFELQAIVSVADMSPHGHEFLYRGYPRPTCGADWVKVDLALIERLVKMDRLPAGASFVNLSHDSLLAVSDAKLLDLARKHDVRFEISEAIAHQDLFSQVCDKVNRLSAKAVQFVIDDFGAGLDGCRRLYSLDRVTAVKVDRDLLISASRRTNAAGMLRAQVEHWNSTGVATIAEGVETQALLAFARVMGFSMVQGFFVDTIVPSASFYL